MALQAVAIKRSFNYNGIDLADPNPTLSVKQVQEFYSMQFPELTNAEAEGPTTANNVAKYVFKRAVGSKGRAPLGVDIHGRVEAIAKGEASDTDQGMLDLEAANKMAAATSALTRVVGAKGVNRPMHAPSEAFGIWG